MAKIPAYNQNKVGVSKVAQGYEHVNANASSFGVSGFNQLAQGFNAISNAADEIWQKEQEKNARALLLEANTELNKWKESRLYDPNEGYFAKKGKDAIGFSKEVIADFDNSVKEINKKFGNNKALKQRFQYMAENTKQRVSANVYNHDKQQTLIWRDNVHETALESNLNEAIANRNNNDGLKSSLANIKNVIRSHSEEIGEDNKLTEHRIKKVISGVHTDIIQIMLEEKNINAKKYFETHKAEILPEIKAKLLEQINVNDIDNKARMHADKIFSMGLSYDEQLKEAQKIKDTKTYDAVIDRLDEKERKQQYIKRQQYNEKLEQAWTNFEQDPSLDNIPANLDFNDRQSMRKYAKASLTGEDIKTDLNKYYDLYNLSVSNPNEFKQINLRQYQPYLSSSDFKFFVKQQGKRPDDIEYTQFIGNSEKIKKAVDAFKLGDDDEEDFIKTIENLTNELENQKGRKATKEEISKIINNMSFEYKGNFLPFDNMKTYDRIKKGRELRADFTKSVINEDIIFEEREGRKPTPEEFDKIVSQQISGKVQQENKKTLDTKNTKVMEDSKGNRALVEIDSEGNPVRVIKEL